MIAGMVCGGYFLRFSFGESLSDLRRRASLGHLECREYSGIFTGDEDFLPGPPDEKLVISAA
jgi:hypothetical protein